MKKIMVLLMGVLAIACLAGCAGEGDEGDNVYLNTTNNIYETPPDATCATPADRTLLDSGVGSGMYDMMTYDAYTSHIWLTPSKDLLINKLEPQIWYCNGDCVYLFSIYDQDQNFKEFATGSWQGKGDGYDFTASAVTFPEVVLEAGVSYDFRITLLTTRSVGIYTTGSESPKTVTNGEFTVLAAVAGTFFQVDHTDRGAVSFKLLYESCTP